MKAEDRAVGLWWEVEVEERHWFRVESLGWGVAQRGEGKSN